METSLMSESVVDTGDVEETVTKVLTHFVQGGGEKAVMSVQLVQDQVEFDLGYDQGSLSKWHNFLGRTLRDFFSAAGPIFFFHRGEGLIEGRRRPYFFFITFFTFCLTHDQPYDSTTGPIGQGLLT